VALSDDLERIAAAAAAHGDVTGVLAAEPGDARRFYLVAFGGDDAREWLVLDDDGRPVDRRDVVRDTASIVVLCELAAELAAGGNLEELRAQLVQLRLTERPPGIEVAEEAALALERAVGAPPRVATPEYVDAVGAATRELELALGDTGSPFTTLMKGEVGTVEGFVREVERAYRIPLA
jgi:hypothetical protein